MQAGAAAGQTSLHRSFPCIFGRNLAKFRSHFCPLFQFALLAKIAGGAPRRWVENGYNAVLKAVGGGAAAWLPGILLAFQRRGVDVVAVGYELWNDAAKQCWNGALTRG